MGADLQRLTRQGCAHVDRLLRVITGNPVAAPDGHDKEKVVDAAPASPRRESRDKTETRTVAVTPSGDGDEGKEEIQTALDHHLQQHHPPYPVEKADDSPHDAPFPLSSSPLGDRHITELYERAFQSLSKSIILLSRWKD